MSQGGPEGALSKRLGEPCLHLNRELMVIVAGGTQGKGGQRWGPNLGQLGWIGDNLAISISLSSIFVSPVVATTAIHTWDLRLLVLDPQFNISFHSW